MSLSELEIICTISGPETCCDISRKLKLLMNVVVKESDVIIKLAESCRSLFASYSGLTESQNQMIVPKQEEKEAVLFEKFTELLYGNAPAFIERYKNTINRGQCYDQDLQGRDITQMAENLLNAAVHICQNADKACGLECCQLIERVHYMVTERLNILKYSKITYDQYVEKALLKFLLDGIQNLQLKFRQGIYDATVIVRTTSDLKDGGSFVLDGRKYDTVAAVEQVVPDVMTKLITKAIEDTVASMKIIRAETYRSIENFPIFTEHACAEEPLYRESEIELVSGVFNSEYDIKQLNDDRNQNERTLTVYHVQNLHRTTTMQVDYVRNNRTTQVDNNNQTMNTQENRRMREYDEIQTMQENPSGKEIWSPPTAVETPVIDFGSVDELFGFSEMDTWLTVTSMFGSNSSIPDVKDEIDYSNQLSSIRQPESTHFQQEQLQDENKPDVLLLDISSRCDVQNQQQQQHNSMICYQLDDDNQMKCYQSDNKVVVDQLHEQNTVALQQHRQQEMVYKTEPLLNLKKSDAAAVTDVQMQSSSQEESYAVKEQCSEAIENKTAEEMAVFSDLFQQLIRYYDEHVPECGKNLDVKIEIDPQYKDDRRRQLREHQDLESARLRRQHFLIRQKMEQIIRQQERTLLSNHQMQNEMFEQQLRQATQPIPIIKEEAEIEKPVKINVIYLTDERADEIKTNQIMTRNRAKNGIRPLPRFNEMKRGRKPKIFYTEKGTAISNAELKNVSDENMKVCVNWIKKTFETEPEGKLPLLREYVYDLYVQYCNSNEFTKINTACFGKCLKRVFPRLHSRRLLVKDVGLKYHYVKIKLRPDRMQQ